MDENQMAESHLTSAAAFVEGGIQEACEDACSICLEDFCDTDPSTVTSCKHEFHLQCILEWCQRSTQCPMCWQPISLKDPTSQELLEAVEGERERRVRVNQSRNATVFHHPTLGNFELQHLPVGADDAELEERIIQHLAAAAAMGRAHHISRREGHRSRSHGQGRPQYLVFSTHPNAPPVGPVSVTQGQRGGENESASIAAASPSVPNTSEGEEPLEQITRLPPVQAGQVPASGSGASVNMMNRSSAQSSAVIQDTAGPSEFQSFSESLKSRFNAVSMRYKESISKSTRGWKEKLFSRNTSVADLGSEGRREVSAGISSVSRMIERLDTGGNGGTSDASASHNSDSSPAMDSSNQRILENLDDQIPIDSNASASFAATSGQS